MDVINAYLETMFSPYPQTPRLLEAKEDLRGMMEDAYNEAISAGRSNNEAVGKVITEFGNLDELAPVLGITSDIRPTTAPPPFPEAGTASPAAGGFSPAESYGSAGSYGSYGAPAGAAYDEFSYGNDFSQANPLHSSYPTVTLQEAMAYSEAKFRTRNLLGAAVALFTISPSVLIALAVLGSNPRFPVSEAVGSLIGLVALLILVALGVMLIMQRQQAFHTFEDINEGRFEPDPTVTTWAKEQRSLYEGARTRALLIAITLWILAAVPTLASGLLSDSVGRWGEQLPGIGVPATLIIVALGLFIFLPANWAASVADTLSNPEPSEEEVEKSFPRPIRVANAVLWPLTLLVFFIWSFGWHAWHISWIVWPIAAALAGVITAIGHAWGNGRN